MKVDATIQEVRISTSNQIMGIKFWEIVCTRKDGKLNRFCIKLDDMKQRGIAKTMNSTKKVETWLNSDEGLQWLNEAKDRVTFTGFGDFLDDKAITNRDAAQ